jgi:hypothetical protein
MKGRDHLEDLCVDERIILLWILKKWNERLDSGFIWLRMVGSCEHGNKPSGSTNGGTFTE